jgi:hypothetical protein
MIAIAHPFSLDSLGRINTVDSMNPANNNNKYMVDRLISLLSTSVYQKPLETAYGIDMSRALYENAGNFTQAVRDAVNRAISTLLPELTVVKLVVIPPDQSGKAYIDLEFSLPDGTTNTVTVTTNEFNKDGTILGDIS